MAQDKYHWEDFKAGETITMGSFSLSEADIIEFARRYDPQPFHIDKAAADRSFYGGLIASGWHTCCAVMRLMCDSYLLESASLGSPGIDELRWLKPVRPGDVLTAQRTILESRASSSKPDMGIVKSKWEIFNQRDECVMSMSGLQMFSRRAPAQAKGGA
jgi:acyl dehydratase